MTGPSIDPTTLSTISAKIDYALKQLSIINEKLDSHEERLVRLEKFQQAKKVGSLLRRAPQAGGYIIDGAPSAAPPSSTQFHSAIPFAASAAPSPTKTASATVLPIPPPAPLSPQKVGQQRHPPLPWLPSAAPSSP